MREKTNVKHVFALALIVGLGTSAIAAQGSRDSDDLEWSLGLGVISSPRPYVGAGNSTRLIPILDLKYKRFYVRGILAGFEMVQGERFKLDLIGRAQFAGYEESDSSFLIGMEKRRESFELGLSSAWKFGPLQLEARAVADALGRSDGVQAGLDLTWSKIFGRGKAGLFPSVGVVWQDADFVDYYAGVRPEEALPERPAFEGSAALNYGAGVRGFASMSSRSQLVWLVRAQRLANEYENSPIIADRWTYFGLLGVTFRF